MVDLAAVAGFVAAGLSLVNVAITARLASRGKREQWRRDEERPIIARCLTLSEEVGEELFAWSDAKDRPKGRMDSDASAVHWEKARELTQDLSFEVAQLELLASGQVRKAARDLVATLGAERGRVLRLSQGGDDYEHRRAARVKLKELQLILLERARADLGLGVARPKRARAEARLLARPRRTVAVRADPPAQN